MVNLSSPTRHLNLEGVAFGVSVVVTALRCRARTDRGYPARRARTSSSKRGRLPYIRR